jgi:hypothetical protein
MSSRFAPQADLFKPIGASPPPGGGGEEFCEETERIDRIRSELQGRLEEVREMTEPVWKHELGAAIAMNDFQSKSGCLPEGVKLFRAYKAELERLYHVNPHDPSGYEGCEIEDASPENIGHL